MRKPTKKLHLGRWRKSDRDGGRRVGKVVRAIRRPHLRWTNQEGPWPEHHGSFRNPRPNATSKPKHKHSNITLLNCLLSRRLESRGPEHSSSPFLPLPSNLPSRNLLSILFVPSQRVSLKCSYPSRNERHHTPQSKHDAFAQSSEDYTPTRAWRSRSKGVEYAVETHSGVRAIRSYESPQPAEAHHHALAAAVRGEGEYHECGDVSARQETEHLRGRRRGKHREDEGHVWGTPRGRVRSSSRLDYCRGPETHGSFHLKHDAQITSLTQARRTRPSTCPCQARPPNVTRLRQSRTGC